jgi:geranylgeranyl reductase family protein
VRKDTEWDVAIVGGGPAGLAAARAAAAAGARTVVIERAKHPRYKTCGGGLIGPSLAVVDDIKIPVRDQIHAVTFSINMEREYTRTSDSPVLAMVVRDEFDYELRKKAESEGAVVLENSPVRHVDQDDTRVSVKLADGSTVHSKILIGADGSAGISARYVGVSFNQVDLGLEVELAVPEDVRNEWKGRILLDWGPIPGSYAWIFPKDDRLTVGVIAGRGRGEETKTYLNKILDGHALSNFERLQDSGHLTRCRTDDSPLRKARVLVAGDAAGLLEPWTREGISFALRSGKLAGEVAASASVISTPSHLNFTLESYGSSIERSLVPEMEAGSRLFAAFTRHPGFFHLALSTPKGWSVFADFCKGEKSFASVMAKHPSARLASSLIGRF